MLSKISNWLGIITGVTGGITFIVQYLNDQNVRGIVFASAMIFVASIFFYVSKYGFALPPIFQENSISVEEAVGMLGNSVFGDRVKGIADLVDQLPNNLSGSDASALLGSLVFDFRVEGIRLLAPKIKKKLSQEEIEQILDTLVFDYHTRARSYLLKR